MNESHLYIKLENEFLDYIQTKIRNLDESLFYCKTKKKSQVLKAQLDAHQELIDLYYKLYKGYFGEDLIQFCPWAEA